MPFDSNDVRAGLRADAGSLRDELVSMSVFHYDNQIRNRTGLRYMRLPEPVVEEFDARFLGGDLDAPGLPDYAACCEDARDVRALAEVCGRTLWAIHKNSPVDAMQEQSVRSFGVNKTKSCSRAYGETRAAWNRSYKSSFHMAMGDTYRVLDEKSPELAREFVNGLDVQSYRCMCQGLKFGGVTQEQAAAISEAFNPDAPQCAVLHATDTVNLYYSPDEKAVVDKSLNGLLCRVDWGTDTRGFYDQYDMRLRTFYTNVAREAANDYFSELTGERKEHLGYVDGRKYSLETVFEGCSDNEHKLARQVETLSEMCSQSYHESTRLAEIVSGRQRSSDIISGIVDKLPYEGRAEMRRNIRDTLMERSEGVMKHTISSHMGSIYNDLSEAHPDVAKQFVGGLSDEAYKGLCAYLPKVEAECPRTEPVPFVPRRDADCKLNPEWFESKGLDMSETVERLAERSRRYGHANARYVGDMQVSGAGDGQQQGVSL